MEHSTLTKADLVENVYDKIGFSKRESVELVESVLEHIKECLEDGENVKITGFGSFLVRRKAKRIGRNPQTGKPVMISARKTLSFRASPVLRKKLNKRHSVAA